MGITPEYGWDELSAASPADVPYRVNILAGQIDADLAGVAADLTAADAADLASAKTYADGKDTANRTAWAAADAAGLADAKTYADGKDTANRTAWAAADAAGLTAAKEYTDSKGYAPLAWKPNTPYTAGQRIVAPNGDVVSAKATFTAGATYSATNWNASTQDGRLGATETKNTAQDGRLDSVEAKNTVQDGRLDKLDGLVPSWDLPGVAFALTAGGAPTWLQVNDTDGGPTAEALSFLTQQTAAGAEKTLPPERNFMISTYTGPRKLRADPALIVGYGDSHMLGGAVPSTRFMSILGTKFPAATVVNRGAGGNTTDQVAVRAGAIRPRLAFAGGSIPASGAVTVTTTDAIAYRNLGTFSVAGTVAGVPGTLARTDPYTLTFTRTTTGTAVTTGPAEFISDDYALYAGAVQIILSGRNDIADDVRLNDGSVPLSNSIDRAVSATVAMVEAQSPVIKKTLILGGLTDVSYVRGTPEYQRVTGINAELQRIYPNYFWDLRGYLVNKCIYDIGFTPTAADLAAMAGDTLPPSIMLPDNTHFGVEAHAKVADQLYAQLIARKLVNA
jgi:hypothetical protein